MSTTTLAPLTPAGRTAFKYAWLRVAAQMVDLINLTNREARDTGGPDLALAMVTWHADNLRRIAESIAESVHTDWDLTGHLITVHWAEAYDAAPHAVKVRTHRR